MNLYDLSDGSLVELAADIAGEQARRDRIRIASGFIAERSRELEAIAAEYGTIPFESRETHLPSQVVVSGGKAYKNVSGVSTSVPPDGQFTVWEEIPDAGAGELPSPAEIDESPA